MHPLQQTVLFVQLASVSGFASLVLLLVFLYVPRSHEHLATIAAAWVVSTLLTVLLVTLALASLYAPMGLARLIPVMIEQGVI